MLEGTMPGEALLSNGNLAENLKTSENAVPNKSLQEMAEKLEKSETNRKRLRQAISMLKEKLDANEKVLQVNEMLRQECEKERQRTETEKKKAEEEKELREKIEKDGLSMKEQFVHVLQRLDTIERACKSDRNEVERMRKEMKQAVSGLNSAVKAIEIAQSSFDSLEKNLLGKVNNAASASSKSSALAQSAVTEAKGAQTTATAAEKLSQSLVSRVAAVQKQGVSLDQRVNILQQELRTRLLGPLSDGLNSNGDKFQNGISSIAENQFSVNKGMVLSKTQGQSGTCLQSPKPADKDSSAKVVNAKSLVRPSISERRPGTLKNATEMVTSGQKKAKLLELPKVRVARPLLQAAAPISNVKKPEMQKCDGAVTATGYKKKNLPDAPAAVALVNPLLSSSMRSEKKSEMPKSAIQIATEGQALKFGCDMSIDGHKKQLPSVLLDNINRLFQKEKKSHVKMEKKLAALTRALQSGNNSEGGKQVQADIVEKKTRKRKRGTTLNNTRRKRVSVEFKAGNTLNEKSLSETKGNLVGEGAVNEADEVETRMLRKLVAEKSSANLQHTAELHGAQCKLNGQDILGEGKGYLQHVKDKRPVQTPGTGVAVVVPILSHLEGSQATVGCIAESNEMDIDFENRCGDTQLKGGWDSESDTSEDGIGDDWWERKGVLLSPTLPDIVRPSSMEAPESRLSSPPASNEMSLEEIALFLDVLPPIDQDACNRLGVEEILPGDPNVGNKDANSQSAVKVPDSAKESSAAETLQIRETVGSLSDHEACLKTSIENNLIRSFETGLKSSDEPHGLVEEDKENVEEEVSFCSVTERELKQLDKSHDFVAEKKENLTGGSSSFITAENVSRPLDTPHSYLEENKENLKEGFSICTATENASSGPGCLALLPQETNVVVNSVCNSSISRSGVGACDIIRESKCSMEDEKVGREERSTVDPCEGQSRLYSLELVLGQKICKGKKGACNPVILDRPGPLTERSREIIISVGRTKKLLYGALSHVNSLELGAPNPATQIASIFASSNFSRVELIWIFTASLVDTYAWWVDKKSTTSLMSDKESLQLLIDIVKEVLFTEAFQEALPAEPALSLFGAQLQKFLIHGSLRTFRHQLEKTLDEGHTFRFTPSACGMVQFTFKALISGSKLFATFCERNGNLDLLRHSIYLVLRFCDKDSSWLLVTVSSFASVCSVGLFTVDKEDMVGQAVHVVISELVSEAEVGITIEHKAEPSEASSENLKSFVEPQLEVSSRIGTNRSCFRQRLGYLHFLREVIGKDGLSFEAFVPKLLKSFQDVIYPTFGSKLSQNQHLFHRSLWRSVSEKDKQGGSLASDYSGEGLKPCLSTDMICSSTDGSVLQIREDTQDRTSAEQYYWRFTGHSSPVIFSTLQSLDQSEQDKKNVNDWKQNFYDITNAVELVASHLGWEWTYNDFIVEHLWKLVAPGVPALTIACVTHVFGVLGRLGRDVNGTELPGVDELRKSLLVVLSSNKSSASVSRDSLHTFSFMSQVAAAEALLVLSSLNRTDEIIFSKGPKDVSSGGSELQAECIEVVRNWFKALNPELQEVSPSSVKCVFRN